MIKNNLAGESPRWYDEESLVATEFRRLYSKIRMIDKGRNEIKNLLVTSATIGEGKSTTAAQLATAICKYRNTSTLLIDCDVRRPMIHELFGLAKETGFVDVALKKVPLKSALKSSCFPKLKILTAGRLIQSPAEIFNIPTIKNLFDEMKFYFDSIIVDSAPTIPVSDPLILSTEVDGALMVVRAGKTPREMVKRATDLMKGAGMNILGIVLNNVEDVLPYYYNYRYHYREYKTENKN